MMRFLFVLAALCIAPLLTSAQGFGSFPPGTRWRQINTDTARVIYTGDAGAAAARVATLLHHQATKTPLGGRFQKIDVVLQSRTTLANGYVQLGPFRSEFYLIPGSNIFDFGTLPWEDQLAVHEYRHVQQYNNFNRGLSRFGGTLFGQEGRALFNALSVPDWFFEGDAVWAETALTTAGRGRTPYFFNGFRALWREGRNYNWQKLRNGSFRDFVPNHYPLGYLLVNYGYEKYGAGFWNKVSSDAAAYKGLFYPFQKAVQRHAAVPFKQFRNEALQFYDHATAQKRSDRKKREVVTNYWFPQMIGTDSLLYLKEGYQDIPAFYIKTSGKESRIARRSISSEEWFAYRNGTIAYTAYDTRARWSAVNFSDVVLLDVATGKEQRITEAGRYYTPDLSPSAQQIVTVAFNDSLQTELHLLSRDGALQKKIPVPQNGFFVHPRFINENEIVVAIRWQEAAMSWHRMNLSTGQIDELLPKAMTTTGFPFVNGDNLYFVSSQSGSDDVYHLQLSSKKLDKLTTGGVGYYFPSVYGDTLTWSQFTSNGFRMQTASVSNLKSQTVDVDRWKIPATPFAVAQQSAQPLTTVNNERFSTTRYSQNRRPFNFHSWRPDYTDPEITVSLLGNNVLNTWLTQAFYRFNRNENASAIGGNIVYGGLYPQLTIGGEHIFNRTIRTPTRTLTLRQTEFRAGAALPLNLTRGRLFTTLRAGSNFVLSNVQPTGDSKRFVRGRTASYLHHFLSFSQQLPQARQQIFSRFGYGLSTAYRHRLDTAGFQSLNIAQVFLPGITKTHSVVLTGTWQETDTANVLFTNRFANARGYDEYFFSRMWNAGMNYHFPLFYPETGVPNIVYMMRVRANLFYDYSRVFNSAKTANLNLRSVGTEIFFDTRWWNQLPLTIGLRVSHLLDDEPRRRTAGTTRFEIILPVDLIPD